MSLGLVRAPQALARGPFSVHHQLGAHETQVLFFIMSMSRAFNRDEYVVRPATRLILYMPVIL